MCRRRSFFLLLLAIEIVVVYPRAAVNQTRRKIEDDEQDKLMHKIPDVYTKWEKATGARKSSNSWGPWLDHETDNSFWYEDAKQQLLTKLATPLNTGVAKNVIMFLGDGMSVPTLMAARTYQGQLEGKPGEEGSLFWETFPHTGLSKTWCLDKQVPDSACTSTAYLGGVKTKVGTVGLNGNVIRGKCETQIKKNHVNSIVKWAQNYGKGTGIVTTTRVTHASPSGAYAHAAERHWESDSDVIEGGYDPRECRDIATQLVRNNPGKDLKVILGGGRREFLPKTVTDEEGEPGKRSDGVNLIEEWKQDKLEYNARPVYIWNRTALLDVIGNPTKYDHVLGLFESSHCPFHIEASPELDPTLEEMVEAAIKILEKEEGGYFLFVEGGRIDHAHHSTYATLALDETVEMAKAVKRATKMTSEKDTLIVVTSDHSHTMTVSGYPSRGNPINGIVGIQANDNIGYSTLTYANGPGYRPPNKDGSRYDPAIGDYADPRVQGLALVPLNAETHGGDDVAIFAKGPWSHLFSGTIQQSNIPHFMAFASCIGQKDIPDACSTS